MKRTHHALLLLAAVCLLLVAACGERHEPTRPTTVATVSR